MKKFGHYNSLVEVIDAATANEAQTVVEEYRRPPEPGEAEHRAWENASYYADEAGLTVDQFRAALKRIRYFQYDKHWKPNPTPSPHIKN